MLGLVHLFLQLGSEPTTLGKGSLLLINERKTPRERLFVALAWLPKATVQAAMGPLALDKARQALARCSSPQFLSPNYVSGTWKTIPDYPVKILLAEKSFWNCATW